MRTLAVEPPPMLDKEERRLKFINRNGILQFVESNSFTNLNLFKTLHALCRREKFLPGGVLDEALYFEVEPLTLLYTIFDS